MKKLAQIRAFKAKNLSEPTIHEIQPIPDILSTVPVTRYYGSKRKLLPWLHGTLKTLDFETALDAFGGTGSVSQLFRSMRKDVTYNDAFRFNTDIASAVLRDGTALDKNELATFLDGIAPTDGFVTQNFQGVFYRDDENRWIDGFMTSLTRFNGNEHQVRLLKYLLYQACLKKRPFNLFHRANLALRTRSDVKRSFGNAATWERSFIHHMANAFDELATRKPQQSKPVNILHPSDASSLESGYDLVYFDPPYVSKGRKSSFDNYWRKYHFLEGLARYSDWVDFIAPLSPIRASKAPPAFASWSNPDTYEDRLFALIRKHSNSIVVLSYVQGTEPTEKRIKDFFESLFRKVSVHSLDHSHALSKSGKRELVFIGDPR